MKLVVAGASGYVATDLIRQALALPQITSVVALARRSVSAPENSDPKDAAKLQTAVIQGYDAYPDDVKKQLADADACIWYRSTYETLLAAQSLLMRTEQDSRHHPNEIKDHGL